MSIENYLCLVSTWCILSTRRVGFTSLHISGGTLDRTHAFPMSDGLRNSQASSMTWISSTASRTRMSLRVTLLWMRRQTTFIMLFDFNYSTRISSLLRDDAPVYRKSRYDDKGDSHIYSIRNHHSRRSLPLYPSLGAGCFWSVGNEGLGTAPGRAA